MTPKVTVLKTIRRGNWLFRVSTFEDYATETYTVMIVVWNIKFKDNLYFRFFDDDERAAAFVDECSSGKYGDVLEEGL